MSWGIVAVLVLLADNQVAVYFFNFIFDTVLINGSSDLVIYKLVLDARYGVASLGSLA